MQYLRATTWDSALSALADGATPLGGGTDLIPLVREGRAQPDTVVDLRGIEEARRVTWHDDGGVTIGAAVTLRELARDARVQADFGALAHSCAAVGSYALRHMGTIGGNLCQHMRCWYFRHGHECLRAAGGSCSAEEGENQYHAIFRQGPCVAVHPSDPAVALVALDATVHVLGSSGDRTLPCSRFLTTSSERMPGETALDDGEVVTAISIPGHSAGGVQHFEKAMQRATWDFALVSLAAVKRRDGEVRLVLGGVANTPWRVADSVEEDVASGGLSEDDVETLAQRALYDAEPLARNAYKMDMAAALLRRAMRAIG